jgi:hypothetical protein
MVSTVKQQQSSNRQKEEIAYEARNTVECAGYRRKGRQINYRRNPL